MALSAVALNCTLKSGGAASSTDLILQQVVEQFGKLEVSCEIVRVADYNVAPGVSSDEGNGDQWPQLRQRIIDSDILVIGTPIWMGQPSSICKRVLERLDAFLGETDDEGRTPAMGKVAALAVVGNEDGAHHVAAEVYQALNDVGFTIPAAAQTYWVGEAMGSVDYKDLGRIPDKVALTNKNLAENAAFTAGVLKGTNYPAQN